ncbi:MAG: amidohydrolase family protein [Desulfitobacteriaceae bacterium]
MEGSKEAVSAISCHMLRGGVTSCLATATSSSLPDLLHMLENAVSARNNPKPNEVGILGIHLEGPYINPQFKGVQIGKYIHQATLAELETIYSVAGHALRMASENPARAIGVFEKKGSLSPGKDADIVVLENDLSVRLTMIKGQIVYDGRC